jgi:purine catabolism regulator
MLLPAEQLNADVVGELTARDVAALLLLGRIDASLVDRSGKLPILAISGKRNIRAAQRHLLTTLIDQRMSLIERGARIHGQLAQLAAEGKGLSGLAVAIADISGRGLLLQDKRLQGLADQPSSSLHAIWDSVIDQLSKPESLPESLRDRKRAGQDTVFLTESIPGGLERVITPITVGGVARGYLSLIGEEGELDTFDRLVAEQGSLVCAMEMARTKAVRETEKRLKGDLLTALLQEDLSSRDAHLWVQTMGLDLTQAHTALRFSWDGPTPPSRRRLETLVNGEVAKQGLKVIVNPLSLEVVCFCQVSPEAARPDLALSFGQAILDQAALEFPEVPARCGVGIPAAELNGWRSSFRQAGQALEMARRLGKKTPLYFPDLSVYRLLLQIEHNPEMMAFQEEILGPLLAYEGGEELIRTLESFFDHNGNLSQAAEALFIHRNTILYRMERIAKISGLDLNNTDTRLAAHLALRIYRMMRPR